MEANITTKNKNKHTHTHTPPTAHTASLSSNTVDTMNAMTQCDIIVTPKKV